MTARRYVFPALLALFVAAYLWRMTGVAPIEPVTTHLSNFYLSGAAVTLIGGPQAFVDSTKRSRAVIAAGVFAAINVVGEMVLLAVGVDDEVNRAMGDVNTSDPVDGLFGLAAIALVLALIYLTSGRREERRPTAP